MKESAIQELDSILEFMRRKRRFDIAAYNPGTLQRGIDQRFQATGSKDVAEYLQYVESKPEELDNLLDVLTVNVSRFFRDSLTLNYLEQRVFPAMLMAKRNARDPLLRIWSAGCADGEEPYSIAILIKSLLDKENMDMKVVIFGTDIDRASLSRAEAACYGFEAIKDMKYKWVKEYLVREGELYRLTPGIMSLVEFSEHDLTDPKKKAPAGSIFGGLDMVFCCNVLIYLREDIQKEVIGRLCRSLTPNGFLILGKAEEHLGAGGGRFRKVTDACPIFQKQ